MPSIQPNSLIVVTGITGYIASHVALLAMREGHRVRGTVRPSSLAKADQLRDAFIKEGIAAEFLEENLELFPVDNDDFFSEEIWHRVFKDADGIEHIAWPIDGGLMDSAIIKKGVDSTMILLRIAAQIPTVKRFVLTSSTFAAYMPPGHREKVITVEDWNDAAVDIMYKQELLSVDSMTKKAGPLDAYAASKVLAEKAAWDFVDANKPQFDLVTVLPGLTLGPVIGKPSVSASVVLAALQNNTFFKDLLLPQWGVDVRDAARIHYLGLVSDVTAGKRWITVVYPWSPNDLFAILRRHFPSSTIPEDWEGGETPKVQWDNKASTALIGGEWISMEKSVLDTAASMKI